MTNSLLSLAVIIGPKHTGEPPEAPSNPALWWVLLGGKSLRGSGAGPGMNLIGATGENNIPVDAPDLQYIVSLFAVDSDRPVLFTHLFYATSRLVDDLHLGTECGFV